MHECVVRCGHHTDTQLCQFCCDDMLANMSEIPRLLKELDVNLTRRSRYEPQPRKSANTLLPYDPQAAHAAECLLSVVTFWERDLYGQATTVLGGLARLISQPAVLCSHPQAAQLHADVLSSVSRGWATVDRPKVRLFLGPCDDCGQDLFTQIPTKADTTRCGCGTEYSIPERRSWLCDKMRDHLATASEISVATFAFFPQPVKRKTITTWARRGLIATRGKNPSGHPLHRIGDILDRVTGELRTPTKYD